MRIELIESETIVIPMQDMKDNSWAIVVSVPYGWKVRKGEYVYRGVSSSGDFNFPQTHSCVSYHSKDKVMVNPLLSGDKLVITI